MPKTLIGSNFQNQSPRTTLKTVRYLKEVLQAMGVLALMSTKFLIHRPQRNLNKILVENQIVNRPQLRPLQLKILSEVPKK